MRIFAVSDLHTDFRANLQLVEQLPSYTYRNDVLLVAGDIADRLEIIEETLSLLREKFSQVFYVPGNHELWARFEEYDSVEKLSRVMGICDRLGIHTQPARAGSLWVVPLFSWYDTQLDFGDGDAAHDLEGWADFHFCRWPKTVASVSEFFLKLNATRLRSYDGRVITLSHFLPRRDLLPDLSKLSFKGLPKVAVCSWLDTQVRVLNSVVHVFGHSHINCDRVIEGVRYVQNALRYPSERTDSTFSVKMIWPFN